MQKRITFDEVELILKKDLQTFREKERAEVKRVLGKVGLSPSEIVRKYKDGEISPFLLWFLQVYDKGAIYKNSIPDFLENFESNSLVASARVKKSFLILYSTNIENSSDVIDSDHIYDSRHISNCSSVSNSINCRESNSITDSDNIICSVGVLRSKYITFCTRINNCRACALCSDLKNGLFCFSFTPENKDGYYIFNTEVSEEEFSSAITAFDRFKSSYEAYIGNLLVNTTSFLDWFDSLPNSNRAFLKANLQIERLSRGNSIETNREFFNMMFKKSEI